MSPEDAAAALEVLAQQVDALGRVLAELDQSTDTVTSRHRFDRWKERTIGLIAQHVNADEARAFEDTYVPLTMGIGEYNALHDQIDRHGAALRVLMEELRDHPADIRTTTRDTGRRTVESASESSSGALAPDPRSVFVIHGRDDQARAALFSFLQDLDLHPMQWEELVHATGRTTPYNGEVVARAFQEATAVIVLMTPDDEARLHPALRTDHEAAHEIELTGQPRPNVFLETGMALQAQPDRTIFVEIGTLRPASDLEGLNVVRLGGTPGPLLALSGRLEMAGCAVNRSNPESMETERFASLDAVRRRPERTQREEASRGDLPRGTRLDVAPPRPAPPALSARLLPRGKDHLLEVVNRGGVSLKNVRWEFPPESNWIVATQVLPEYPIQLLEPREHIRVPVALTMQSKAVVDIELQAEAEGETYTTKAKLSIYD